MDRHWNWIEQAVILAIHEEQLAEHGGAEDDPAVPERRGEEDRHQGAERPEMNEARERGDHGTEAGQQAADEEAEETEALVLRPDKRQPLLRKEALGEA